MSKNPYKHYTLREVSGMEDNYYCLIVGGDFVFNEGIFLYTRKEMSKLYNSTLKELMIMHKDGTDKEKRYALEVLGSLRIVPFRLH